MQPPTDIFVCKPQNVINPTKMSTNDPNSGTSDPPPPTLEPTLPTDGRVAKLILRNLSLRDRLNARLLNSKFNSAFKFMYGVDPMGYTYTVDGSRPESGRESLLTLYKSRVQWRQIKFNYFVLEDGFLGDEKMFYFFSRRFCPTLTSLTFHNCKMRMGRFIELLPFCPNLTHLRVVLCPSLFSTTFEILGWDLFFKKFYERLEHLQDLEIVDSHPKGISEMDLTVWTSKMKSLRRLKIHCWNDSKQGQKFPHWSVLEAIKNNEDTLAELDLNGHLHEESLPFFDLLLKKGHIPKGLEVLRFKRLQLVSPSCATEIFSQFTNIKHLCLGYVKIPDYCFSDTDFSFLESLSLERCRMFASALDRFSSCPFLKSVTFKGNYAASEDFKILQGYRNFFKNAMCPLEDVTFRATGGAHIIPLIIANRTLTSLDISGMDEIDHQLLAGIRTSAARRTLKCLKMKSCGITDKALIENLTGLKGSGSALETLEV